MAIITQISTFWDVAPLVSAASSLTRPTILPENGSIYISPKQKLTFTRMHGPQSQRALQRR
jgi:hypothetical protein